MGVAVELIFVVIAKGVVGFFLIVLKLQVFFVEVGHVLFAVLFGEGVVGVVLQVVVGVEVGSSCLLRFFSNHHSLRGQSLLFLAQLA